MPNANRVQTVYIDTGNPDTMNQAALYKEGELGAAFDWRDRAYQVVRNDTGATSATATGVVAANQLAFWKDKNVYLVTNNSPQALGMGGVGASNEFRNQVAGLYRYAVTAGNYCCILQRGDNIPTADGGNTFAAGESVIAEAGTAAAADRVAVGTATTYQKLGIARGAASGGNVNVDWDIPNIP